MITKNYSTSQIVTAMILDSMWNSCRANRASFAAFKAKYTDEFIDDRLAEIEAALALPSEAARSLGHVRMHNELETLAKEGRKNWQALKLYISDYAAASGANLADELAAAGQADYEKASNNNFPSLKDLLLKGSEYIAANTILLSAHQNMPAGFPAAYNLKMDDINAKLKAYYAEVEASRVASALKTEAFNSCYRAGISMGADGQHIFSNNEEMRKQFSYEAVSEIITPPGAASLAVEVMVNSVLKQGAEVSIEGTDKRGTTDVNGETMLTQLSQGPAVCKIVCDGCADQFVNVTLSPGTTSRIKVTLEPLFQGEMTVGSEQAVNSEQETATH